MTTASPLSHVPSESQGDTTVKNNILPKATVQQVMAYVPPLEGRRTKIRLDFNENTEGFPEDYEGLEPTWINTYPEYQKFLNQLSQTLETPQNQILITNGSDEALCVLANTFIEPGVDRAVLSKPTFALIPHYLTLAGSTLVQVPILKDLAHDIAALEAELAKGAKMAVFASPDNPTGTLMPQDVIMRWVDQFPDTLFVLDEAYSEYSGKTLLNFLNERVAQGYSNLMITRTFSKAWGLAGLRLGVIIGHPTMIGYLTRVRSPYSVNTLAVALASNLLPQKEKVLAQAKAAVARKDKLIADLEQRGYPVKYGYGSFFLMKVGMDAKALDSFVSEHNLLLRDRSTVPELKGMIRVSTGTADENEVLLKLLDEFKQKRALLFDLDGTLVDTTKSYDETVKYLVHRYTGDTLDIAELKALRQAGGFNDDWDATLELLKQRGKTDVSWDEIAKVGTEHYLSIAKDVETLIISEAVLARLKQRYRLGIVTGRYCNEFDSLWKERLSQYFEVMVCRDSKAEMAGKPAADTLQYALEQMGVTEGTYIGNNGDDMRAAIAAGLTPVGIATTLPADHLLASGAESVVLSEKELEQFLGITL